MAPRSILVCALAVAVPVGLPSVGAGIENTPHNLAVTHEGSRRPGGDLGVCVFCHAPHNAMPSRALWNLEMEGVTYKLYESSTLESAPNQPSGASRLCLSCHDGTVASWSPRMARVGAGGILQWGRSRTSLGTDLSDDHPISFSFDSALATHRGELIDPPLLRGAVRLDEAGQLQCTSCHNPHEDRFPKFLTVDNRFSQLCLTCHSMRNWQGSAHASSPETWKGTGSNPWPDTRFGSVAENGCGNCHRPHSAGHPQWLLRFEAEEQNCLVCHSGTVAPADVGSEFNKISSHPVEQREWVHEPWEDPVLMQRHVTCSDCHNPHRVEGVRGRPDSLMVTLRGVKGVNASGSKVIEASAEYEVCYSCHGLREQQEASVIREDNVTNARLEFDPGNDSYHPVVAPGRNPDVSGLEGGYTPSSRILCSHCHGSDSQGSGPGPRGPHGSAYPPILEREYLLGDDSSESSQSYALCYKCHNRALLLSDMNGFPHRRHVVELQAPCAVCHDAHGSRRNSHLINFMTATKSDKRVVAASGSGRLAFEDLGRLQGRCFLSCHGSDHDPKSYP